MIPNFVKNLSIFITLTQHQIDSQGEQEYTRRKDSRCAS